MAITPVSAKRAPARGVVEIFTVEIAANASVADTFMQPPGYVVAGITPIGAGWDAADLAVNVTSTEGGTMRGPVKGPGGTSYLKCAVTADVPVTFPFSDMVKWTYLQLLSCTANNAADVTPVAQTAKRTIEIVLAPAFN